MLLQPLTAVGRAEEPVRLSPVLDCDRNVVTVKHTHIHICMHAHTYTLTKSMTPLPGLTGEFLKKTLRVTKCKFHTFLEILIFVQ